MITYFGQAAFLMANPEQVRSTRSWGRCSKVDFLFAQWACAVLFYRCPILAARHEACVELALTRVHAVHSAHVSSANAVWKKNEP